MINTAYARLKQLNTTDDAKHIAQVNTQARQRREYARGRTGG